MGILSVPRGSCRRALRSAVFAVAAAGGVVPGRLAGQTDFYNTDEARPVRIEDAYQTERYAFELQFAPLRLERESGGVYTWEVEPEVAYGILPRTQVEVALPLALVDAGGEGQRNGLAGIRISALHNLNVETAFPALGIAGSVLLPVGGLAPDEAYGTVKGLATRTFRWARFHANAEYTVGSAPGEREDAGELSRWMAGVAVDRTFPLRSALVTADVFVEQALDDEADLRWTAEAGLRRQVSPVLAFDAGVGRRFAGDGQGWFVTLGSAYAFGIRSLIPVRRP